MVLKAEKFIGEVVECILTRVNQCIEAWERRKECRSFVLSNGHIFHARSLKDFRNGTDEMCFFVAHRLSSFVSNKHEAS